MARLIPACPPRVWTRPDQGAIVTSITCICGVEVKPSHGEPPGISAQDDERRALVEQREALLQILELRQKDFHAGDLRDLDEFLEELDSDSADVSLIVSFSAETFLKSGQIRRAV